MMEWCVRDFRVVCRNPFSWTARIIPPPLLPLAMSPEWTLSPQSCTQEKRQIPTHWAAPRSWLNLHNQDIHCRGREHWKDKGSLYNRFFLHTLFFFIIIALRAYGDRNDGFLRKIRSFIWQERIPQGTVLCHFSEPPPKKPCTDNCTLAWCMASPPTYHGQSLMF